MITALWVFNKDKVDKFLQKKLDSRLWIRERGGGEVVGKQNIPKVELIYQISWKSQHLQGHCRFKERNAHTRAIIPLHSICWNYDTTMSKPSQFS